MRRGVLALLWALCIINGLLRTDAGPSCGLNAVRHRQEHQLRKLLGDSYGSGRRLQAATSPQTRLQKLLANSQPATMRIHTEFQLEAGFLTAEQTKQLKEVLVPGAVKILQQYVKVRIPSSRPIRAVRDSIEQYCGEADAQVVFKGEGFKNTDQVYYFTALSSGSCDDNIIAYTIICHMEPYTYRPNVAAINVCRKFWSMNDGSPNKQVAALVHEMIHGLGFSDRMYPFLYDSSNGVQYNEVVREHQLTQTGISLQLPLPGLPGIAGAGVRIPGASMGATYASDNNGQTGVGVGGASISLGNGGGDAAADVPTTGQYDAGAEQAALIEAAQRTVLFLVTPKLAAFAREYYGCPSLPGAPADALSEGSHWRQANVNHELMQPASAEDSQRKRISQFTLTFLDDTGWYVTDKSSAQELEWGRGAGCDFVLDGCSAFAASHAKQAYYCTANQESKDVCTYDSRGIGICSAIPGTQCYTARADVSKPLLYCQDSSSFQKAGRQAYMSSIRAVGGVVGAPSSRCFSTPQQVCVEGSGGKLVCGGDDGSAVCMEAACDKSGKLQVLLRVPHSNGKMDTARLQCKSDGAILDLAKLMPTKFKSGQIKCPNAGTVCPTLDCKDACSNGYCWRSRCYCHMEFTGPGCSQSLVPSLGNINPGQSLPAPRG